MTKNPRWITTQQAADLLGVKPETVYAYVSRGLLERHRGEDRRSSRFDRVEIERLARRNRRGGRAGALEVVIDTELTMIDPAGASTTAGTTRSSSPGPVGSSRSPSCCGPYRPRLTNRGRLRPAAVRIARRAQSALPASARTIDRLRVVVAALAAAEAVRDDRRPAAVAAAARSLIAGTVDAFPNARRHQATRSPSACGPDWLTGRREAERSGRSMPP